MFRFFYEKEKSSPLIKTIEDLDTIDNKDIVENGLSEKCKICVKVIELFTSIYGSAAGNIALITLPTGGLYLLGGLSIALEEYILRKKIFYVFEV